MAAARQLLHLCSACCRQPLGSSSPHVSPVGALSFPPNGVLKQLQSFCGGKAFSVGEIATVRASTEKDGTITADDGEEGVSLGTMKLPLNTDIPRFEILLFQWANSLCQGANLPLPVPLKVDKVQGGARLGFIEVDDGKTKVFVYIDCLVFPANDGTGPLFRAIRDGPLKDRAAPGEERIMRSLLQAIQKSAEIARI